MMKFSRVVFLMLVILALGTIALADDPPGSTNSAPTKTPDPTGQKDDGKSSDDKQKHDDHNKKDGHRHDDGHKHDDRNGGDDKGDDDKNGNNPGKKSPTAGGTSGTTGASASGRTADPVCFPLTATARTVDGRTIPMKELSAGDRVHVAEDGTSSRVYLFTHRILDGIYDFVQIEADNGKHITLSSSHYIYVNEMRYSAGRVKVGDIVRTVNGKKKVVRVRRVKAEGLVAPHTMHGDLVVDDFVVSSYTAAVHPRIAHFMLLPVRMIVRLGLAKEPLGRIFYSGDGGLSTLLPSGPHSL